MKKRKRRAAPQNPTGPHQRCLFAGLSTENALGSSETLKETKPPPPSPNVVGPRLSDDLLVSLLAKALVEVSHKIQKTGVLHFPFPSSLTLLFHHFAAENLWKQREFPTTFQAVWLWAHRPFGELGLSLPPYVTPDEKLLVDGLPTVLCYDLVMDEPDPEAEISARLMREVQEACYSDQARGQMAYVAFRRLLIQSPVLTMEERDRHYLTHPYLHWLAKYIEKAYEEAPRSAAFNGYFELCPHCQNLCLPTRDGTTRVCSEPSCRRRLPGKTSPPRRLLATAGVLWLRPGLRRYVTAPGQTEVRLAEQFKNLGITTELWPGIDTYDLRLCFQDGEVWAIDVKDWRNPLRLAKQLNQKGAPPSFPRWDRWFWVFPDYRKAEHQRWLRDFYTVYPPRPKIRACFEKEIIAQARKKLMARTPRASLFLTAPASHS